MQGFQETRKLIRGEVSVFQADGSAAPVLALGNIIFSFDSGRVLILKDVLYAPAVRRNLISVSKVLRDGYDVSFSDNGCVISYNKHLVSAGTLIDGLFIINVSPELQQIVELNNVNLSSKRKRSSDFNETYLWHLRLCHINLDRISRLVRDGPLGSLKVEALPTCESCLEGKMTKRPFPSKGNRVNDKLELIHSDLCGPMNIQARGGYEYFVTFIDDYSKYGYIYLLRR